MAETGEDEEIHQNREAELAVFIDVIKELSQYVAACIKDDTSVKMPSKGYLKHAASVLSPLKKSKNNIPGIVDFHKKTGDSIYTLQKNQGINFHKSLNTQLPKDVARDQHRKLLDLSEEQFDYLVDTFIPGLLRETTNFILDALTNHYSEQDPEPSTYRYKTLIGMQEDTRATFHYLRQAVIEAEDGVSTDSNVQSLRNLVEVDTFLTEVPVTFDPDNNSSARNHFGLNVGALPPKMKHQNLSLEQLPAL